MSNKNSLALFAARNGIFMALIVLVAFFSLLNKNFLTFGNAENIILQSAELGIVAIPLAFLLISGSVDLSIGAVASAAAVTSGLVMSATQNTLLGIGAGLALGLVAGVINGFLVSYVKLNPIVVTLGFLSIWAGYAQLITSGRTVQRSSLPEDFRSLGTATIGPVPLQMVLLVIVVVLGWYVLNRTRFGKETLAIGGNEKAAYLMGVSVQLRRFQIFIASGVAASITGMLLTAKVQSASPVIGTGMELAALTVVLLGGIAFEGGVGRISGVVAGLLFFKVLNNGLVFLQASAFLQTILVGATLVIAVTLDSTIQEVVKKARRQIVQRVKPDAPKPDVATTTR